MSCLDFIIKSDGVVLRHEHVDDELKLPWACLGGGDYFVCHCKRERFTVVGDESVLCEVGCKHTVHAIFDIEPCGDMVVVGHRTDGGK